MIPSTTSPVRSCISNLTTKHTFRLLSSYYSSTVASIWPNLKTPSLYDDEASHNGKGSAVYHHTLKHAPPATISRWKQRSHLHNSVSLIGSVVWPVKRMASRRFGVYTVLKVDSPSVLRILLQMWDEIAETAIQHLKPNDYIYVSGSLGWYVKPGLSSNQIMHYKVIVKELNYVKQLDQEETPIRVQKSSLEELNYIENCARQQNSQTVEKIVSDEGRSSSEKHRHRLHLWQVFFSSPREWYDNRKTKKNPRQPDFVHKDTREALWFKVDDPPWIRRQLQLLDSSLAGMPREDVSLRPLSLQAK